MARADSQLPARLQAARTARARTGKESGLGALLRATRGGSTGGGKGRGGRRSSGRSLRRPAARGPRSRQNAARLAQQGTLTAATQHAPCKRRAEREKGVLRGGGGSRGGGRESLRRFAVMKTWAERHARAPNLRARMRSGRKTHLERTARAGRAAEQPCEPRAQFVKKKKNAYTGSPPGSPLAAPGAPTGSCRLLLY